jgi:hypothetical protein
MAGKNVSWGRVINGNIRAVLVPGRSILSQDLQKAIQFGGSMDIHRSKRPKARKDGLLVRELSDEVVVYDVESNKALCLNETAALVWKHCDGQKNLTQIARQLTADLNTSVDEKLVWYALRQLSANHLLETKVTPPAALAGMNRRQMVKALGLAAVVAVPVVTSIVAPSAAQAASCRPSGAACNGGGQCCSGLCSANVCA